MSMHGVRKLRAWYAAPSRDVTGALVYYFTPFHLTLPARHAQPPPPCPSPRPPRLLSPPLRPDTIRPAAAPPCDPPPLSTTAALRAGASTVLKILDKNAAYSWYRHVSPHRTRGPYDERGRRAPRAFTTTAPPLHYEVRELERGYRDPALVRRARPHPDYKRVEEGGYERERGRERG
ncbi:hypothetical protein B0H13DRAFT_2347310 [Mycena leptocephala]|nr:hypothetical protein B0H13DRAFT_2347310 [Mycena leptocephala]